jgi:GH24 family phage-related lysozyme (muramidase)
VNGIRNGRVYNYELTQNQYDVLVSLAFNMGVENLRKTRFIQLIKRNNFTGAAKQIKKTGLRHNFPGLKERRLEEYKRFIS